MALTSTEVILAFATFIFNLFQVSYGADHILSCNGTDWLPCPGPHQVCNGSSHQCYCMNGFVMVGQDCMSPNDSSVPHTTVALVTIFTLALVICGLVLVVRKYNLIEYVRQKINLRRNNDVLYEDVMIGHDDPPLSP